jgi:hypothetical protein
LPFQKISRATVHPLNVSAAIVFGALTHVGWDALTHANSPLVSSFSVLRIVILDLDGGPLRLYKFLQHASSVLGLGALIYSAFLWWRRSSANERQLETAYDLSTRLRVAAVAAILIASLVGAASGYKLHPVGSLERLFFHVCIGGMAGFAFGWCAVAVLIKWRWRVQEAT